MVSWFKSIPTHQIRKRTIRKKPMKKIASKLNNAKPVKKEKFTITTFTERGAKSLKGIYEKAGYKFIKSKVTPDRVFLTFEG